MGLGNRERKDRTGERARAFRGCAALRLPGRRGVAAGLSLGLRSMLLGALLAASGCGRSAPNATAEGAAREFVEQSAAFGGNPAQAQALFELLSSRGRDNLRARADRYGAATGRTIEPSAMIVPSRLTLRFAPRSYRATVTGDHATVEVRGAGPSDVAQIPCVLEQGLWQVDLLLPELPPMRKRPSDEP